MRRVVHSFVAVTLLISACLVVSAGPAAAGSVCAGSNATNAPDGKIKIVGRPFKGVGNYPETRLARTRGVGAQVTFKFKWKNVAGDNLTIRVNLHDARKGDGFGVQWFLNGLKVSSVLKGGDALVFHNIAPGRATPAIELVVKNKGALDGATSQFLRGRYGGSQPNRCDMLGARVDAA